MRCFHFRVLLLTAIALSAGTLWLTHAWCVRFRTALTDPPRLHVAPGTRLAVEVGSAGKATGRFLLSNHGGRRLLLSSIDPDCECLDASPPLVIAPGDVFALELTFPPSEDSPAYTWRFMTNDPHRPRLTLTLHRLGPET